MVQLRIFSLAELPQDESPRPFGQASEDRVLPLQPLQRLQRRHQQQRGSRGRGRGALLHLRRQRRAGTGNILHCVATN